jgi:hypothetical protein
MPTSDELAPGIATPAVEPAGAAARRGRGARVRPEALGAEPPRAGTALSTEDIAEIAAQVAAIMQAGAQPSMVVPPPRVGVEQAPEDDETMDPLADRVQAQARARLGIAANPAAPRAQGLTDDEVLAMFQEEELGEFDVPNEIKKPGMAYGWKLHTALGRGDSGYEAELRRRGWLSVKHEDHPGAFGTKGETGPILRKGLQLMMRTAEMEELRQRYYRVLAKTAVRDKIAQMASAPPGTGPRTHERVRPSIKRTYEQLPIE